jgi:methylisocitrate lyase
VTPVLAAPEAMAEKIRAAVEARSDPDFLIIARTDAPWATRDLEDAVRRLNLYAEAGADLVMAAGMRARDLATVRQRIAAPVVITDQPGTSLAEERASGAAIVLYYGLALYAAYEGVAAALAAFRETGDADAIPKLREGIAGFEEFMGYGAFAERAKRHGIG